MSEVAKRSEMMLPGPAEALGGLLGVPVPDLGRGEPLPLLWHWLYLLDRPRQADLGPDGHPARGTIPLPPAAASGCRPRFGVKISLLNGPGCCRSRTSRAGPGP